MADLMTMHNSDPLIGSIMYDDFNMSSQIPMSMDFENSYMQYEQSNDVSMVGMHSPISDSSEIDLGFQESGRSPSTCSSPTYSEQPLSPTNSNPSLEKQGSVDSMSSVESDIRLKADQELIASRYGPHEFFPADREWTLEQKAEKLIAYSECSKYTAQDLLNLTLLEKPDDKIGVLIEVVARIPVPFRWHFVNPEELYKPYTVVANCKKEKVKRDAEGRIIPKRPMNAFMIWCQKCRTLMAHICPQLHNAIISKALGAVWKTFTKEDRAEYEREKKALDVFHKHEYPDYKYRPKKKAKKGAEPPAKLESVTTKSKSKKKKKKDTVTQPAPLKAINLAEMQHNINLDPLVKERLQVKMQVKIDPDFKREMGKRGTAIDIADLSAYHSATGSISSPNSIHYMEKSSVFDTPENSPHEPRTPSPHAMNNELPSSYPAGLTFKFEPTNMYPGESNNNNVLFTAPVENLNLNIKLEPGTLPANLWQTSIIKTDPTVSLSTAPSLRLIPIEPSQPQQLPMDIKPNLNALNQQQGMPVLSADDVDSVFEDSNEDDSLSNIQATLPTSGTDIAMDTNILDNDFPDIMRFLHEGVTTDVDDLLRIESSSLVMEGPATV